MNSHDDQSYKVLMLLYKSGKLNFDIMTEQEISTILDYSVERLSKKKPRAEDMTLIDDCLNSLKRFDNSTTTDKNAEISTPTIKFIRKNNYAQKHKIKGLIVIAAVISTLFLCTAVAYAAGYNIFDIVFSRNNDQAIADIKNQSGEETFEGFEQKSYSDVNTFIKENSTFALKFPALEAFDTFSAEVTKDDVNNVYLLDFTDSIMEDSISFAVTIYNDNSTIARTTVEIDDENSETFKISDIVFYLESNYENNSVTWFNKNYSVKIYSNLPVPEIKEIINLYYGGQD